MFGRKNRRRYSRARAPGSLGENIQYYSLVSLVSERPVAGVVTGLQHSAHLGSAKETPRFLQIVIAVYGFRRMHVYVESSDHKKADVFLKAGVLPRGLLCGRPPTRDKIDPLVVVFSEIKRCQHPQFTQIVQKARNRPNIGPPRGERCGRRQACAVKRALNNEQQ